MPIQEEKITTVLASGVFDLLHLGHVKFLEEAKKLGGKNSKLVVIVARDSTVEETKQRKPVVSENQRRSLVESLKVVDLAVLGLENFDVSDAIETIKPDIIALGYDQLEIQQCVEEYIQKNKLEIKVAIVSKFEADELDSSSKIRQKIVEKFSR